MWKHYYNLAQAQVEHEARGGWLIEEMDYNLNVKCWVFLQDEDQLKDYSIYTMDLSHEEAGSLANKLGAPWFYTLGELNKIMANQTLPL